MVQVAVLPCHNLLDHLVKVAQGDGGRHLHDPADFRLDVELGDFQLVAVHTTSHGNGILANRQDSLKHEIGHV